VIRALACLVALAACGRAVPAGDGGRGDPPAGWHLTGPSTQFRATVDRHRAHGGQASARLEATSPDPDGAGTLVQQIPAERYRGRRVRFSGLIATDGVTGWAGLWMRVDRPRGVEPFDNMQDRAIHGTTDWTRASVVLDVAADAVALQFGVLQDGPGTTHLDDAALEIVGADVAVTDRDLPVAVEPPATPLLDGDFEAEGALGRAWAVFGDDRAHYAAVIDRAVRRTGAASARLQPRAGATGYGVLIQSVAADGYRGHRIRVTAAIKTTEARGDVWLHVQGPASPADGGSLRWAGHPLDGTADWRSYELVVDVPPAGDDIEIGAGLRGHGTLWIDDVHLEIVDPSVALTRAEAPPALVNGSFEIGPTPEGWFLSGGASAEFDASIDRTEHVDGAASARLRPRIAAPTGYATLMQSVAAERFRGKRVRLTARVKGQAITGRGDLWLRVQAIDSPGDGPGLGGRSFQLAGSFAWRTCETVFDVPEAGEAIQLGIGLAGPGTVWLDQVALDEVARDVSVTALVRAPTAPRNLDFETLAPGD
jgi:hypothetical protein